MLLSLYPDATDRANEKSAADKTLDHAATPTIVHLDALGRTFMTIANDGAQLLNNRIELDVKGNQLTVRDADTQASDTQGRVVMRYTYNIPGSKIHQVSMEAGARWMLDDIDGKTIRSWDSRGHRFTTTYDTLRRPQLQFVTGTTASSDPRTLGRNLQVDKMEYGESLPTAQSIALNLRTRVYRHSDTAGITTNARFDQNGNPKDAYDYKGNLLCTTRRLLSDHSAVPDWSSAPLLRQETLKAGRCTMRLIALYKWWHRTAH
ncbi:MAG: hypothetical protein WDO15_00355 [Bacteroidota bacterium]